MIKHLQVFQLYLVFVTFFVTRCLAALLVHITDCDETFNYWEPVHFLLFNKGLQTWEYNPSYGLRSYAYLLLNSAVGGLALEHGLEKLAIFYTMRIMFALICTLTECLLFSAIKRKFGQNVANSWFLAQVLSPGMYIASVAFLPSSFSMYLTMIFLVVWWNCNIKLSIFSVVVSGFIGWPFAILLSIPFVYDVVVKRKLKKFIFFSIFWAALVGIAMVAIDSYYYGKLVFYPVNIIVYNMFSPHGPNLYGIESSYFYVHNLFLNFNFIWISCIAFPIMCLLLGGKYLKVLWNVSPLYLWIAVFFSQPHKEERFMFPVYPMISLCGALAIPMVVELVKKRCSPGFSKNFISLFMKTLKYLVVVLCLTRILALFNYYRAPMEIFSNLDAAIEEKNVCFGKEWHRFPGHFFLPTMYRVRFIQSHFKGMLPSYFDESCNGTRIVHSYFNDQNKGSSEMIFNVKFCDFLVDFDEGNNYNANDVEPNYSKNDREWEIVARIPFLNAKASSMFFRAFYIPFLSSKYIDYGSYNLLKRK